MSVLVRNEIRTGLFVVVTLGLMAAVLIYYGAAGDFLDRKRFQIYFTDAGGIQPGASVTLSGRKVGQVRRLISPVPESERPEPELEVMIEVDISITARIYRDQQVIMLQYGMLGDQLIDFTQGKESSGVAPDGSRFIGRRQPGLNDAIPVLLDRIDPLLNEATSLVKELQSTAKNLSAITAEGSDFHEALDRYKNAGRNLEKLTGDEGDLAKTLKNLSDLTGAEGRICKTLGLLDAMTGKESDLALTLANLRDFTGSLKENRDIGPTIANFRRASEQLNATLGTLNGTVDGIAPCVDETVRNAAQFTDTLKRQPWRLIWPSTKKYPEDEAKRSSTLIVETTEQRLAPLAEKPSRPQRITPKRQPRHERPHSPRRR